MEHSASRAEGDGDPFAGTAYRRIALIGRGGIGEVYLVEHMELRKRFAAKVLRAQLSTARRQIERLRREARALGAIPHPNIVAVSDAGVTPSGHSFVVMERLVGCTLHSEMKARRLPLAEALSIARAVLSGLAEAHRAGFVHRDIKPANVFLHQDGDKRVPKILDFGVAKFLASSAIGEHARVPLTAQGQAVGTPLHMSPEQASGRPVDARADLYAVGLLLYEMITGRGPFATRDPDLAMAAHVNEAPLPPSALSAEPVPAELDAIVLRALEKDPADRFQTAEQMSAALAGLARGIRQPVGWLATVVHDSSDPPEVQRAAPAPLAGSTLQSAAAPEEAATHSASSPLRPEPTPQPLPAPNAPPLGIFAVALLATAIVVAALVAWLFAGVWP